MKSGQNDISKGPSGCGERQQPAPFSHQGAPNPSGAGWEWLGGGGEMAERIRSFDWERHPLGSPEGWPQSLKVVIRIMLNSRYAMWMGWGEEFYFFCNDAYLPTVGLKRNWVLGASARKVWAEIWPDIGPRAESVVKTGRATWDEALLLFLERSGFREETYHTFSYSAVPDDRGAIGGMLCVVTEDTERVIGERRMAALHDIAAELDNVRTEEELFGTIGRLLGKYPKDLPFGLIYLFDADMKEARLVCSHPGETGSAIAPVRIHLEDAKTVWPAQQVAAKSDSVLVPDLAERFDSLPTGPWDKPPELAVVVPLMQQGQERPAGFCVAGINPYRPFDTAYRGFLDLLMGQIAAALSNVRAYEEERRRAEALAQLDRAKTAFFSNVSHEFRTPLTLMLGPVEDLLSRSHTDLPPAAKGQLEVVNRNGLRLLRLVNTLLDFSRIEAGRVQAVFEPTELGKFTSELASAFRAATEQAGLSLRVDCPKLPEPVYVDRDMWERIVLNLISNAFKFTLEGEIEVKVGMEKSNAVLSVRDTGVGIPAEEMPRIFERFHRVQSARGRTHEGSGIGLALVQELVKLHHGSIRAVSQLGAGTTLTVTMPLGSGHLPVERLGGRRQQASTAVGAAPFVEEALRWLPEGVQVEEAAPSASHHELVAIPCPPTEAEEVAGRPRILVADDNADMRQYLARLLRERYNVEAVPDGRAALAAARERRPDVILSDVMMPNLDGFGLVQELRADEELKTVPIILLSARAGEESRVEGLQQGADDYLVKPFSARELMARVGAHLDMARMRKEAAEKIRESEERYRTLFGTLLEGFCIIEMIFDDAGRPVDYRFLVVNPAFDEQTGLHDAQGKLMRELVPDHEADWFEIYGRVAQTGEPARFINRARALNRWYDVSAYRVGGAASRQVAILFNDITEAKRAEEALRESERRLALALEASGGAMWGWDIPSNRLDEWDARDRELYGLGPEEEATFDTWLARVHPDDRDRLIQRVRTMLETVGDDLWNEEFRVLHPQRGERWICGLGRCYRDEKGRALRMTGVNLEVTERRQAQEVLERSKDELEELVKERTAKLQELVGELEHVSYTITHDMRAPLRAMRAFAELLRSEGETLQEEGKSFVERIIGGAERLDRLITDALNYTKTVRSELPVGPVDVERLLRGMLDTYPEFQGAQGDITVERGLPLVIGNEAGLTQCFSNLIGNAVKFVAPGARPEVRIWGEVLPEDHRRDGHHGDGEGVRWARLWVEDKGIGISQAMVPRVFDMFSHGSSPQAGTGIGLALARKVVERMGGRIGVVSKLGRGSKFWVELKAGDVRYAAAQKAQTEAKS